MSISERPESIACLFPELFFASVGVQAKFCPTGDLEGQPGWVQGGFVATVLDYVCAAAANRVFGEQAITGTLSVRYGSPVLIDGGPYEVSAAPKDQFRSVGRSVRIEGVIVDPVGVELVTATGLFIRGLERLVSG